MNYIYKGFEFSTNLEFYRIIAADINTPYIKECKGICNIYYPKKLGAVSRITTKFQEIYFTYSNVKYHLKSIDPVSVTIIEIKDLNDTLTEFSESHVSILSNSLTDDLISEVLVKSKLFEVIDYRNGKFRYKEIINFFVNETKNVNKMYFEESGISLLDTKNRYLLDFTKNMYALYETLEPELKKKNFYLKNLYETEEVKTREVATLQYDNYPEDYFRLYPNWNTESTSYRIPVRLTLNTSSISKFERLLFEYQSLKFISNIVRLYLKDSLGRIWTSNLKWNHDVETNSPMKAENDRNEVSYYIVMSAEFEFSIVRNDRYYVIRQILLNHKDR